jgi:hypothetical protein
MIITNIIKDNLKLILNKLFIFIFYININIIINNDGSIRIK